MSVAGPPPPPPLKFLSFMEIAEIFVQIPVCVRLAGKFVLIKDLAWIFGSRTGGGTRRRSSILQRTEPVTGRNSQCAGDEGNVTLSIFSTPLPHPAVRKHRSADRKAARTQVTARCDNGWIVVRRERTENGG